MVLLDSVDDTLRDFTADVELPEPRARPILTLCYIEESPRINRRRKTDAGRVVKSEALLLASGNSNPPKIHLSNARRPRNEVDPLPIERPCMVMMMLSRSLALKQPGIAAVTVGQEHRISRCIGVKHHPAAVLRPCHLCCTINQ